VSSDGGGAQFPGAHATRPRFTSQDLRNQLPISDVTTNDLTKSIGAFGV
jgi:hypothetical protein